MRTKYEVVEFLEKNGRGQRKEVRDGVEPWEHPGNRS